MTAARANFDSTPCGAAEPMPMRALPLTLSAAGTDSYLPRLLDLIGCTVAHDRITVTRYAPGRAPEFLSYRNFSAASVTRYLDTYHPFDPFFRHWCEALQTGVVPLARFGRQRMADSRYTAEFLTQSAIRDEVGVLLDDGPDTTLGVFLERTDTVFSRRDVDRLARFFPTLAAVHDVHRRLMATEAGKVSGRDGSAELPAGLWPELSRRERQVAALMIAGHPSAAIAVRLGLTPGTVRNHRLNLYAKLDITSEREVFVQYLAHRNG